MSGQTTKLVYLALLITFAVVIHTIESFLVIPIPVPGAKLGLANIITLLALMLYGFRSSMVVSVMRTLIGFLIVGNLISFSLSLSGAVFSTAVMGAAFILYKKKWISILTVSVLGAASHNVAQIVIASFVVSQFHLITFYLPILLLLAVPTGVFTGLSAMYLYKVILKNATLSHSFSEFRKI